MHKKVINYLLVHLLGVKMDTSLQDFLSMKNVVLQLMYLTG